MPTFEEYIQSGPDKYEAVFRDKLQDGAHVTGRLIGLANNKPPVIVFEETRVDGSSETTTRIFDHGTPENIRSVFRIPGMAEHFLGMIRAELKSLIDREIIKEKI